MGLYNLTHGCFIYCNKSNSLRMYHEGRRGQRPMISQSDTYLFFFLEMVALFITSVFFFSHKILKLTQPQKSLTFHYTKTFESTLINNSPVNLFTDNQNLI